MRKKAIILLTRNFGDVLLDFCRNDTANAKCATSFNRLESNTTTGAGTSCVEHFTATSTSTNAASYEYVNGSTIAYDAQSSNLPSESVSHF